jgi:hypothetical protein
MKKSFLIAIINLIFAFNVNSQVLISLLLGDNLNSDKLEFGLEGGGNLSKIGGLESNSYLNDWNVGFYFDIVIKENKPWNFYTGVLVKSRLGTGKLTEKDVNQLIPLDTFLTQGTYKQRISTFVIPVFIKYKFNKHIYLEAGPQFGLIYKAWVEYINKEDGEYVLTKKYNKDLFNKIDFGFAAGTGYRFKGRTGWTVGVKYYYGFVDAIKTIDNSNNQAFFLKLNIPIGRGETAQLKREKIQAKKEAKKEAGNKN